MPSVVPAEEPLKPQPSPPLAVHSLLTTIQNLKSKIQNPKLARRFLLMGELAG